MSTSADSYCVANPMQTGTVVIRKGPMTFESGQAACQAEGLRLAVIRKQQDLTDIKAVYRGEV